MRTRRFENTLRERESEAASARCRPVGFCLHALPLGLLPPALLPAGPSALKNDQKKETPR